MSITVLAALAGFVAGLRAMMPLAAVSWAAFLGWLDLSGSWLSFLGHWLAPWILTLLAAGELITDQLPSTPSRKVPMQFVGRLVSGAVAGAAIGTPSGQWLGGAIAGVVGAVLGTLGGAEARRRLVQASGGRDRPIAFLEDAVAILLAVLVVSAAT